MMKNFCITRAYMHVDPPTLTDAVAGAPQTEIQWGALVSDANT